MQENLIKEKNLPKAEKNKVYRVLADFNGFSHGNDYGIENLLKKLKEKGFAPYIEEVLGYRKTDSGLIKEYILKFEGYKNHFLVTFYVDEDYKTTEVNFYFTDSAIKDTEMIIEISCEDDDTEVEEIAEPKEEIVKEDFEKFSQRLKTALKRSSNKNDDFQLALNEIDEYCENNNVSVDLQEKLEDELWNIVK